MIKENKNKVLIPKKEYIQHLAARSQEINITNKNSKTGVCCNNLAFPTCTCREDAPCKASGECYCLKGTQTISNVIAAYLRNLMIYNNDHNDFWEQIKFKIKHNPLPLFRFFDCGDILDYEFFEGMIKIAKEFPKIKFMSFTKKYDIVNTWISIS